MTVLVDYPVKTIDHGEGINSAHACTFSPPPTRTFLASLYMYARIRTFSPCICTGTYACLLANITGESSRVTVVVDCPVKTIDHGEGINSAHADGKPAQSEFARLSYDPETDTSLVLCRPRTGRTHQVCMCACRNCSEEARGTDHSAVSD